LAFPEPTFVYPGSTWIGSLNSAPSTINTRDTISHIPQH
jgi:hypothetical protein